MYLYNYIRAYKNIVINSNDLLWISRVYEQVSYVASFMVDQGWTNHDIAVNQGVVKSSILSVRLWKYCQSGAFSCQVLGE